MTPSTSAASGARAKCFAPSIIPSSSTSAPTTMRPGNGPASWTALAAYIIAATPDFMSALPRPCSRPSRISPPNGSTVHGRGRPRSRRRCAPRTSASGPGPPPPSITATTFGRPGATSSTCGSQPKPRIGVGDQLGRRRLAAAADGSLTLRMRTSSWVKATTASSSTLRSTSDRVALVTIGPFRRGWRRPGRPRSRRPGPWPASARLRPAAGCRGAGGSRRPRRSSRLDDPALVHHRHPVADVPDHRQVVRDEHQRE